MPRIYEAILELCGIVIVKVFKEDPLKFSLTQFFKVQHYLLFLKNGPFPASFSLFSSFQYTVDSIQMFDTNTFLPMTVFNSWTSCIGSDHSTN